VGCQRPLPRWEDVFVDTFVTREFFTGSEFYNEWWKPQGMDIALGANLLIEGPVSMVASVYRPASRSAFSGTDTARFLQLLPHLQRAMQLRQRLASAEMGKADFRAALDALDKPALMVDRRARVLYANRRAEALISGHVLPVSGDGRLSAWKAGETSALHRLVFDTFAGGAGGKVALHRPDGRPVTLLVSALHRSHSVLATPSSLILVDDPDQLAAREPDAGLLRAEYRLTNSEVRLVAALLGGAKLRVAAGDLGITFATARTHLASVFQKTEVHSQAELVRLLIKAGLDR